MKILFFSDIHGIVDNLDYLKNLDNNKHFDKIVCLGDLYYDTSFKGNVDILKVERFLNSFSHKLICIKGNCDSETEYPFRVFDDFIINVDGLNIYCSHGHLNFKNKFKNSIFIYGHEHIPYIRKKDDIIYICVGSISLPRGNSECSYLIYENNSFTLYTIYEEVIDKINIDR